MPRLRALYRHWRQHPPVHLLVAAYLDFKPPTEHSRTTHRDEPSSEAPAHSPPTWMPGMGGIPASDALRRATTQEEGLAAAERMFFGEMMEI